MFNGADTCTCKSQGGRGEDYVGIVCMELSSHYDTQSIVVPSRGMHLYIYMYMYVCPCM